MENPLQKYVDVEEREDGVYLRVTRKQRDTVTIHEMARALRSARVTNCDLRKVEEVVRHARGGFERIGPPFEYYNPALDTFVELDIEPLLATMRLSSMALTEGVRPTVTSLRYCLRRKGIKFGIDEEALEAFAAEPEYDIDTEIAEGKPPREGHDGEVEFLVKIDPDVKPKVDERGRVDYRDIQSFTAVQKGQPLARRIPPRQGEPGTSVTGEEIPAETGKDVTLPGGKNTEISEDGIYLLAAEAGVVYQESGLIHVGELLQIAGDVDYSVGNVKYSGDVVIKGSVKPGFTVESEADIRIDGEVESARIISRNGTVEIGRGVIGKNETFISGKLGVRVGFAQEATIVSEGTVTVEKHSLHCTITCNALETDQGDSSIVGGEVRAFGHLAVATIGNDKTVHTKIALVNKQKLQAQEKTKELQELKAKIQKELEPLARDLRGKSAIMKKAGASITDRHRQELKKLIDAYNALGKKVRYVDSKMAELKKVIDADVGTDGYIKVTRDIYPGVELDLYGVAHKSIDVKMTGKVFRTDAGEIQTEG